MAGPGEAGPSTAESPIFSREAPCIICATSSAKYTCPRCRARTCSLACSSAHKSESGCSGERDRAAYVPMNAYGLGALMDDYVFLEDVGRAVEGFGRDIARNGLSSTSVAAAPVGMRGRGRGRGRGGAGGVGRGRPNTKRDVLKLQLEARDIDVEMLPPGMHRRTLNQSTWDFKNQTALLTLEFRVHPPADVGTEGQTATPYTLLAHRCPLTATPLALLQAHVTERTKPSTLGSARKKHKKDRPADTGKSNAEVLPAWLVPLALPHPDVPDAFEPPIFFIRASQDPLSAMSGVGDQYVALDGDTSLSRLLKGRTFVEFPTLEVCEVGVTPGRIVGEELVERPRKRRKVDAKGGGEAIGVLVGAYGSESDEDEEQGKEADSGRGVSLDGLGEYTDEEDVGPGDDDDDDVKENDGVVVDEEGAEDMQEGVETGIGLKDGAEPPGPIDYAALLDIMQQQGATHSDDEVDWSSDVEK